MAKEKETMENTAEEKAEKKTAKRTSKKAAEKTAEPKAKTTRKTAAKAKAEEKVVEEKVEKTAPAPEKAEPAKAAEPEKAAETKEAEGKWVHSPAVSAKLIHMGEKKAVISLPAGKDEKGEPQYDKIFAPKHFVVMGKETGHLRFPPDVKNNVMQYQKVGEKSVNIDKDAVCNKMRPYSKNKAVAKTAAKENEKGKDAGKGMGD